MFLAQAPSVNIKGLRTLGCSRPAAPWAHLSPYLESILVCTVVYLQREGIQDVHNDIQNTNKAQYLSAQVQKECRTGTHVAHFLDATALTVERKAGTMRTHTCTDTLSDSSSASLTSCSSEGVLSIGTVVRCWLNDNTALSGTKLLQATKNTLTRRDSSHAIRREAVHPPREGDRYWPHNP